MDRFPRLADQLIPLFDVHRALETSELFFAAGGDTTLDRPLSEGARPANSRWPTIAGYEVLEEVGRGGMGVVYKARQIALNRLMAGDGSAQLV